MPIFLDASLLALAAMSALAGADQLSLPIGTGAVDPDVMGVGRKHTSGKPRVGRNSPTTFNSALYQTNVFWDGRMARLKNGKQQLPTGMQAIEPGNNQIDELVTFLRTLTDPCVMDRNCIAPWIPKPGDAPDGHQLNAIGRDGKVL